ncbi:restriction endonuclease subunit S [Thauera aminoaromatica]|uniref:restriction endonuclease subunit S n=1 Tax=Thauera aminoaromatica TaxID=164330 RepID=UPI0035AF7640
MTQCALGDVAAIVRGISFPKEVKSVEPRPGDIACLRTTNVQRLVEWDDLWFVPANHVKRDEQYVKPGDILISTANSYQLVGKVALVAATLMPATIGAFISLIRARDGVDPKFLYHQIAWGKTQSRIRETASTTTNISNVSTRKLEALKLEIPPLCDQHRIVAEIEKQFSRLDEAVANLKRVRANLKHYRAAVLKAAVEGCLVSTEGELLYRQGCAHWRNVFVGDVAQVLSGFTKNPARLAYPRKLPYLRVANVYANELRLEEIEKIGVADHEIDKLRLRRDDMLVVEGNGSPDQIGRVALWDASIPDCVHQNHLIKVRFGNEILPQWALICLLSPGGRQAIERVSSSTSGLHTLSTGKIRRLPLPLPPLAEQHRIVAEVDRRLSIVREVESEVDANLKRAQALREAVLARAFAPPAATCAGQSEHAAATA